MLKSSTDRIIERLGKDNLSDLNQLFFAVYGRKIEKDFFFKKYNTAYTGVAYIGFIAYNQNRIPIAFYGVIPCFLCCDDAIIPAAQSADTMTHPAFRNQGLFVRLAELTIELCRKNGIHLLFGFPNQHSLPGFVGRLDWEVKNTMHCFVIPVKPNLGGRVLRRISIFHPFYHRYQNILLRKCAYAVSPAPYELFANKERGVLRSQDYLSHKQYNQNQFVSFPYASAWLKMGDGLIIGDLLVDAKHFDEVIDQLCSIASKMGLNKIVFHCTVNARLHALFAARCIPVNSFPVIFKSLRGERDVPDFSFTYADIDIF